jgi:hypothetical protein
MGMMQKLLIKKMKGYMEERKMFCGIEYNYSNTGDAYIYEDESLDRAICTLHFNFQTGYATLAVTEPEIRKKEMMFTYGKSDLMTDFELFLRQATGAWDGR